MDLTEVYGEYTTALKNLDKARVNIRKAIRLLESIQMEVGTEDAIDMLEDVLSEFQQITRVLNE